MNLQASSSTQTALIVLTTAGRSMHYLTLSHILLRHICVATGWEQLLGSFCSCCFRNTAALDNSMSANCRTSCPRYKRPTSYLCGIAQFISTRIASSQLISNVLSHPEFWISHVENVLWIWHRALHCAYSQRNPKKLVSKGRGYWPAQAGRGTAGEGWQQNKKCWSHHQLRPNNRLCGDHVVDPQHYLYSCSYSTAAIDRRSTTAPSKSEATPKSESIMAEAIELSGANPEARPREQLGSLVQSLLHHAKCKLSPSRSLSLSLVVQMWERENTVAVSAFRQRSPHRFTIQSSKTSMTLGLIIVGGNWFFLFFRGEISQAFGLKFSFVIFCL